MRPGDRQWLKRWEAYVANLERDTPIDPNELSEDQGKRKAKLLNDFKAFSKYYFPTYVSSDFAPWHIRWANKIFKTKRGIFTGAVHRDGAKSVVTDVLLAIFLMLNGKLHNCLLVSYNFDNAVELITPLKLQLESNQRLIHDFGKFKGFARWEDGHFVTTSGISFRALGSGQSPRGIREQEARPDVVIIDDLDEDTLVRNTKRVENAYDWLMGALFPAMSITGAARFIMIGNIIAKDSLLVRMSKKADYHVQVNLLNKEGQPNWPARFTREECLYMIERMGTRLSQREYFNNPIQEGTVFQKAWMQYKKLPKLNQYSHLVAYLDPGFKKTKTSDGKSWVLVGIWKGEYHIIKAFNGQATIQEMIGWGYELDKFLKEGHGVADFKMEELFLQDLLYADFQKEGEARGYMLPVGGDKRKKPDKDSRIAANSGHFERGNVYLNAAEENNHHMLELVEQYLNFEPGVKTKIDGPDAVEGAIHLLQSKRMLNPDTMLVGSRTNNKYKI